MSNLVIVAIPSEDDYIHKISSEKVPHMTLLFLGEITEGVPVLKIAQFLEHTVNVTELGPFGLEVDYRDTLGEDEADVLFFKKDDWNLKRIAEFRGQLLGHTPIRTAYDSTEQFPVWHPHLTLGYPKTPAKEDKRDYPGTRWVEFDRIALWYGDYEGPEFRLTYNYDLAEVAMSKESEAGAAFVAHFGVKGMKWGQRKGPPSPVAPSAESVVKSNKFAKTKIKTKGGENHPATDDAIKAALAQQKIKLSGTHALTNAELRDLANRLNLEQQVHQLTGKAPKTKGKQFTENLLKDPNRTINTTKGVVDTGVNVATLFKKR